MYHLVFRTSSLSTMFRRGVFLPCVPHRCSSEPLACCVTQFLLMHVVQHLHSRGQCVRPNAMCHHMCPDKDHRLFTGIMCAQTTNTSSKHLLGNLYMLAGFGGDTRTSRSGRTSAVPHIGAAPPAGDRNVWEVSTRRTSLQKRGIALLRMEGPHVECMVNTVTARQP